MNNDNSSEDFWDLDDDDDLDFDPPAPAEEATPEPAEQAAPAPLVSPEPEPDPETAPPRNKPTEIRVKGKVSANRTLTRISPIEKISILAVIVLLGAIAAWGLTLYYKHAPEGNLITFDTDFPIQGESTTVSEVETWWRHPIREGENADQGVRTTINLIPCARIKITDTKNALLWVTFRNGERDLVGDPINLAISNGKFVESGSDEIEIHSTSGFTNSSEINAYGNGDIDPWSVVIVEAKSGEEFSSDSEPFVNVRIEATIPNEK